MKCFPSLYSIEQSSHVTWWSPALLAVVVWQGDSLLVGQAPHNARARARPAVGGAAAPRACVPARTRPRLTLLPVKMIKMIIYDITIMLINYHCKGIVSRDEYFFEGLQL
jgi:hypothetical protein